MREIKFRAWDKTDKIMHRTFRPACHCQYDFFQFNLAVDVFDGRPDNMILMQYTGLKDKNGVEIYEGDVVNIDGGGKPNISSVYFANGCFCLDMNETPCELKYYIDMPFCQAEVIGNIYENPELINGQPPIKT